MKIVVALFHLGFRVVGSSLQTRRLRFHEKIPFEVDLSSSKLNTMSPFVRTLLSWLIAAVGVASLLATTGYPSPMLWLTTTNNYSRISYEEARTVYACPGEQAVLEWFSHGPGSLSAEPAANVTPQLSAERVELAEAALEVSILGPVTFKIEDEDGLSAELNVDILPEAVCTGFAFPVVGWYEGELNQSVPSAQTLPRQLRLLWLRGGLSALLSENLYAEGSAVYYRDNLLRCELSVPTSKLECAVPGDPDALRLNATVTADGLTGTYSGVAVAEAGRSPYEGSFTLSKRTGAPPAPDPEEAPPAAGQ